MRNKNILLKKWHRHFSLWPTEKGKNYASIYPKEMPTVLWVSCLKALQECKCNERSPSSEACVDPAKTSFSYRIVQGLENPISELHFVSWK